MFICRDEYIPLQTAALLGVGSLDVHSHFLRCVSTRAAVKNIFHLLANAGLGKRVENAHIAIQVLDGWLPVTRGSDDIDNLESRKCFCSMHRGSLWTLSRQDRQNVVSARVGRRPRVPICVIGVTHANWLFTQSRAVIARP